MTKRTAQELVLDSMNETFTDAFGGAHDDDIPEEVWTTLAEAYAGSEEVPATRAAVSLAVHEALRGPAKALHWERDRSLTDAEMGFGRGRPDGLYGLRGYRPDGAKWPVLTVAVWADHREAAAGHVAGFNVTCKWRRRAGEWMESRSIPIELMGDVASMLADVDRDLHRSHRDGPG